MRAEDHVEALTRASHILVGAGAVATVGGAAILLWLISRGSAKRRWELQRAHRIADGILEEAKRRQHGLSPRPYPRRFGRGRQVATAVVGAGVLALLLGLATGYELADLKRTNAEQGRDSTQRGGSRAPGFGDCVRAYYTNAYAEDVPSVPCDSVKAIAQVVPQGSRCGSPFRLAGSAHPDACLRRVFRKGDCMPAWLSKRHARNRVLTVYIDRRSNCGTKPDSGIPERPDFVPATARWGQAKILWVRPWEKGRRPCWSLFTFKRHGFRVCVEGQWQ